MTFWDWWQTSRQEVMGNLVVFFSVLGGLLTAGALNELINPGTLKWLAFTCALVTGVAGQVIKKRAQENTTTIKVAEARAVVATAMQDAINSTPGDPRP